MLTYIQIQKYLLNIGRTARFQENYDRETVPTTSLSLRTSGDTHSLVCARITTCTELRWRDICARVIACVTPARKTFIVTQNCSKPPLETN